MYTHKPGFYEKYIKRLLDILISGLALIILSPTLLVVSILVAIKLGRPVIFHQQRPGKNEKIFGLCKFRSMTNEKDENGNLLPDEVRLTKFGSFLRKTSLDELPELWNIFKGDMSLIGPRPLLIKYLPYYDERQKHRHDVRPGLSGLAQVHGRNLQTWDQRFEYDLKYIENITFLNDLKIVFQTFSKAVIKQEGVQAGESVTMMDFVDYCNEKSKKKDE